MLVGMLSMMLTACETIQITETTDTTCDIFCEVRFSLREDSPETIVQNKGNNAAFRSVCPPKPCSWSNDAVKEVERIQSDPQAN